MNAQEPENKTSQHLVAFQDNERSLKPHAWIKSDYTVEVEQ